MIKNAFGYEYFWNQKIPQYVFQQEKQIPKDNCRQAVFLFSRKWYCDHNELNFGWFADYSAANKLNKSMLEWK